METETSIFYRVLEKVIEAIAVKLIVKAADSAGPAIEKEIENLSIGDKKLRESQMVIIGLGQCGENILLTVSALLTASRNDHSAMKDPAQESESFFRKALKYVKGQKSNVASPKYWFEPGLIVADLFSKKPQKHVLEADLKWLNLQGCGNIQIKAQYLARIALNSKETGDENWGASRAYLLAPLGKLSSTKISISLFSAGGGSGSGFTPELSYA